MYITKESIENKTKIFDWDRFFNQDNTNKLILDSYCEQTITNVRNHLNEDKSKLSITLSILLKNLLKDIAIGTPEVLELGAATGFATKYLIGRYGGHGVLVDNSEIAYNTYKFIHNPLEDKITYLLEDIFSLGLTEKFDIVCSFGLVEHFIDKKAILDIHKKFLTDNGLIVIAVPMDSPLTRTFFEVHPELNLGYRELLTKKELMNILAQADLDIIKIQTSTSYVYDFIAAVCRKSM